jgi:hypothetical protein
VFIYERDYKGLRINIATKAERSLHKVALDRERKIEIGTRCAKLNRETGTSEQKETVV